MVKQLQHSSLNFSISRLVIVEPFGSDGVDLVDENDSGSFFFGHGKGISDHFGTISDIHLN